MKVKDDERFELRESVDSEGATIGACGTARAAVFGLAPVGAVVAVGVVVSVTASSAVGVMRGVGAEV